MCFVGGALFGKGPREHKLSLEDCGVFLDHSVDRCSHPVEFGVAHEPLDTSEPSPGLVLEPAAVQTFGRDPELNHEIGGQIFGIDLASLLAPEPKSMLPHHDP